MTEIRKFGNGSTMGRKATNKLLQKAKKSKSDEFYTQLCDIESELKFYKVVFVEFQFTFDIKK